MNFPNNPAVGDIFEAQGLSFIWNGSVWALVSSEAAGGGVPRGGIIMWSGAANAIPPGWALCDGANGRPDLRGRFIIGAGGVYNPGDTGGAESVTLTEAQMPAHTHAVNLNTDQAAAHTHGVNDPGHSHPFSYTRTVSASGDGNGPVFNELRILSTNTQASATAAEDTGISIASGGAHTHAVSGTTGSRGGGAAHENRPPYFALAYIIRL